MKNNFLLKKYMELAVIEAKKNFSRPSYGGPFGACVVKNGEVIAVARNTVLKNDATSHAEINAIRESSRKLKTYDLSGCCIYSTTEPCPMCFSAIHWARIGTIIYGTSIGDVEKLGFNELRISNLKMKSLGRSKVKIIGKFFYEGCRQLLKEWNSLENKILY